MKLLSYNVLAQCTTDYLLREGVSAEYLTREHRTPLIMKVLSESDADIICLQEVDDIAFEEFQMLLQDRYTGKLEQHKRMFGNACFWKHNLYGKSMAISFQDVSGRIAQQISFENLVIYNVHLDFKLNITQVEKLIDQCGTHYGPTIICGDFNASPTSKSLEKLKNVGFSTYKTDLTIIRESSKVIDFILVRDLTLKSVKCMSNPKLVNVSTPVSQYSPFSSNAVNYFPNKNEGSDHIALIGEL